MVENSTYIVYITLREVTFMGTNKILSHLLHSRDFAKFHLIKFNLLNFSRIQRVTQNFICSHQSYFAQGAIYDVDRIFNRGKKSYDFLKIVINCRFFVEIREFFEIFEIFFLASSMSFKKTHIMIQCLFSSGHYMDSKSKI